MSRLCWTLTTCLILILATTAAYANTTGFAVAGTPAVHSELGRVNIWATAVYPEAPNANCSWTADMVPDVVWDQRLVIRINFTADSGNWKQARVGLMEKSRVEVPLRGEGRGDILQAEIPISHFTVGQINGLCPIIGQKGSHKAVISLFGWDIGRQGIYNEDWGLLRFNLIIPPVDPAGFPAVPELGLTAKEAYILCFSGGLPAIGHVARDLTRQIAEQRLAGSQSNPTTSRNPDPPVASQTAQPARPPVPQPVDRPAPPRGPQVRLSGPYLDEEGEAVEAELTETAVRIRYSFTQGKPVWKERSIRSNRLELRLKPNRPGQWTLRVQAIDSQGRPGPEQTLSITANGGNR